MQQRILEFRSDSVLRRSVAPAGAQEARIDVGGGTRHRSASPSSASGSTSTRSSATASSRPPVSSPTTWPSLGFDDVRTGVAAYRGSGGVAGRTVRDTGRRRARGHGRAAGDRGHRPAVRVDGAHDLPQVKEVGVMHACGHDIHVAVQLGVASVLRALQPELPGTVVFLFQPAEEGPPPGGGGRRGADARRRRVRRVPARSDLRSACAGGPRRRRHRVHPRPARWPAVDHFRIAIRGEQAHGAAPHLSVDPVVMAAQTITALQTIRSRNLSPAGAPAW